MFRIRQSQTPFGSNLVHQVVNICIQEDRFIIYNVFREDIKVEKKSPKKVSFFRLLASRGISLAKIIFSLEKVKILGHQKGGGGLFFKTHFLYFYGFPYRYFNINIFQDLGTLSFI